MKWILTMAKCRACHNNRTIKLIRDLHTVHLCLSCASISMDKINDPDIEYDEAYYSTYYTSRDHVNYIECQELIHECKSNIKEKILDYGAGSGVLAHALMDEGYAEVFMYDKSVYAQKYMNKRFPKSDKVLKTTKKSVPKFQTIFMTDVISHLEDVDDVVIHLTDDLTTPDGCVIIRTPIFSVIQNYFLFMLSWLSKGKFDHIILFTRTRFCLFTSKGIRSLTHRHSLHNLKFHKKSKPPYNPGKSKFKKNIFKIFHYLNSKLSRYNQLILVARKNNGK